MEDFIRMMEEDDKAHARPLAGTRAYLSGPIEHGEEDLNWREEPIKVLTDEFKVKVFDPFSDPKQKWTSVIEEARDNKDYDTMQRIAKKFIRKDLTKIQKSDFVVAYVPYRIPTVGTVHEIIKSNEFKYPTLLVCSKGKAYTSLWYWGFIRPEFIFGSWDELYSYLREVNNGKHKDNDRWDFVYGLI